MNMDLLLAFGIMKKHHETLTKKHGEVITFCEEGENKGYYILYLKRLETLTKDELLWEWKTRQASTHQPDFIPMVESAAIYLEKNILRQSQLKGILAVDEEGDETLLTTHSMLIGAFVFEADCKPY